MISVIIPVYNAEESIVRALESVKNQTSKEAFEIITVNDGSTDQSKNIIENYREENPALSIIVIHQENRGVSAARNAAMKMATGAYIAFLDADDEWLPEKTEEQMRFLQSKDFNIDFLATRRVNHQLLFPYKPNDNSLAEITFRKLMFRNEAQPSTVIFTKKILSNTGFFDDEQKYAEDLNFWLKISEQHKMFILDRELVIAGGGKRSYGISGLSANLKEMEKGFEKNLKEMLHLKRITHLEFLLYFVFYKSKYFFRISRNHYLKVQGK